MGPGFQVDELELGCNIHPFQTPVTQSCVLSYHLYSISAPHPPEGSVVIVISDGSYPPHCNSVPSITPVSVIFSTTVLIIGVA